MSVRIVDPRTEILALLSATGFNAKSLSRETGIPQTRLGNALAGYCPLSIDDLTICKNKLSAALAAKQQKVTALETLETLRQSGVLDDAAFQRAIDAARNNRAVWSPDVENPGSITAMDRVEK